MKLSKHIDVFGLKVKLKWIKNLQKDYGYAGQYCEEKNVIELDPLLLKDEKEFWQTLSQEIFHAVSKRLGYDQALEKQAEEIITESYNKCLVENFNFSFKKKK